MKQRQLINKIKKEYNKQGIFLKSDISNKKPFLMREPIHIEGRTFIEKIEYWFFKKGLGGMKSFCKWYRTTVQEDIDSIDLDVKDIN